MIVETHPLQPFLPQNGKMLFLGSFPPPKARWSMEWFYPNWINDFWRIQGLIHFNDQTYFEISNEKRFDKNKIVAFCQKHGLGFFDTAMKVCRLKDNASDDFLEIIEPTPIFELLAAMPNCSAIITTGGKASEELCRYLNNRHIAVKIPAVGKCLLLPNGLIWWRMPSTSRAYPMKLEKKAILYKQLFS